MVQKTKNTEVFEVDKMVKWLTENYFYDGQGEVYEDEEYFELDGGTQWNVNEDILADFCKQFKVQVRATGIENGIGFVQVVHIYDTGEIISNEEISYKF